MELVLTQSKGPDYANDEGPSQAGGSDHAEPGWAKGLRQLYNSVVEEPLPESFDDLLKKLDQSHHE